MLTLDAYAEMLELHNIIFTAVQEVQELELNEAGVLVAAGSGKRTAYPDICARSQIVQN